MIPLSSMQPREPIYTFIAHDGSNTNIASARLRSWLISHARERLKEPLDVAIEPQLAREFLLHNVVSQARVHELMKRYSALQDPYREIEPCILGLDPRRDTGYDGILIDGHHRYFLLDRLGIPSYRAWVLLPEFWHPFRISGLPDLTQAELAAIPITQRSY